MALKQHAAAMKLRFLAMYKTAQAGHIGSALSCAEMLSIVHMKWMAASDRLILSKGHAAAALYASLAETGELSALDIDSFYKDGTRLAAHPPPALVAKSPFATGSLGHGLSLAAGMALGAKLSGKPDTIYCLSSDGELNEGSIWEAALFAAHHRLDNLVWLVDRNGLQGFGRTEEVMALEPLLDKIKAFGLCVAECQGHDFEALEEAYQATLSRDQPRVLVCKTIKGHGLSFMADTLASHYLPLSDAQYQQAIAELRQDLHPGQKHAS